MKQIVLFLSLAMTLITTSAFADGEDRVAPAALQSFQSSFKSAKEVNWSVSQSLYKAEFLLNGQYVNAFYSNEGKMVALTRNISTLSLPITLQADLKNCYDAYWITDVLEVANEEGTTYFLTLEDADNKIILKSLGQAEWTTYKKQRKS